ncbi:NAD(P)/FAD-dependent oxidoreductase [Rhizobium laguerreae]|uniref:NAD(P)/FAD-dependent oxidoreductase n=1 Tax=Rhizobium laguerreae TaxID=1076926 RepID=UPI001C918F13|nr:FAD-binding oxidoreductase [Rhizobium laguerreae]MBY3190114.1 FAD-binding oxidoreductase [Rhizobium laguerreae]MBY3231361.1 FAD-binding oxidoreductase [Rhizobium laguerreae]MBY3345036.1 FAD-binding oxidoreductase [Rhizobium laguerreae]MBY3352070.1 FAD-binding oxidoreductase [Rhizobium laguerreae]MBY3372743.1 FAD-binding oxidoreductase [Rhizobium laguerreae]
MASQETWQSPIAPGLSWYQATVGERPTYPALDGSRTCDVAIVGGGYTGLQAAYNLAKSGVSVVLIDACRFGDGASGRNGGQLGTGQRWWPEELEEKIGYERSKALFDLAEAAKRHLIDFAREHQIEIDYVPGQLNVAHKASYKRDYYENAEIAALRYGYPHLSFMDEEETQERLGSKRFHCGVRDVGTGHIHPLKLLVGLARVAANAGAEIFEMTKATAIRQSGGKVTIETERGTITAERALIACNGHIGDLEAVTASHVMPIRSFIGATAPLDGHPDVLPGGEAVADSRFVVRYFRKFGDGRLLFGGREAYTSDNPRDISLHIRRQIAEIYPDLKDIEITHAWGGNVGITMPRQLFVREVMPGVISIGGYSGHGVMLSNYCGKLYAETVLGKSRDLDLFTSLDIPAFPGGARMRAPLLFLALSWFALRDKF